MILFVVYLRKSLSKAGEDVYVYWSEGCKSFWTARYGVVPQVRTKEAQLCKYLKKYTNYFLLNVRYVVLGEQNRGV